MIDITKNIEAIRKEKRIKQEVIAAGLGIKQNTYSTYITRNSDVTFSRLSQISDVLQTPIIDIITYPEKYVPETSQRLCENCMEKDRIIQNLNEYIEMLKKKVK